MSNIVEKTFIVHSVPDYNTLVALIKEMNGCILHIATSSGHIDDSDTIKVKAQGEENHLLFAEYLFKKYQAKIKNLNSMMETASDV